MNEDQIIPTVPQIDKLAKALASAQAMMTPASKDATNPYFNSKYADLASIWEACREPLSKNELSVVQLPSAIGKTVTVRTILLHSSGQLIESALTMEAKDATPQSIGSAITYARRYGLSAIVGISSEDDDGNAASSPQDSVKKGNTPAATKAPEPKKPDAPDVKEALSLKLIDAFDNNSAKIKKFLGEECGVEKLSEITREQVPLAIAKLNQIIKDKVKK